MQEIHIQKPTGPSQKSSFESDKNSSFQFLSKFVIVAKKENLPQDSRHLLNATLKLSAPGTLSAEIPRIPLVILPQQPVEQPLKLYLTLKFLLIPQLPRAECSFGAYRSETDPITPEILYGEGKKRKRTRRRRIPERKPFGRV